MEATTPSAGQQPARQQQVDPSLEAACRQFNEAFNRHDAQEVASHWAENGSLITPGGERGDGRAGVQRVFQHDADTILAGTSSTFTIAAARPLGPDLCLLDLDHDLRNFKMADGSKGAVRLHVVILAQRKDGAWRWLDARPYAFATPPGRRQ